MDGSRVVDFNLEEFVLQPSWWEVSGSLVVGVSFDSNPGSAGREPNGAESTMLLTMSDSTCKIVVSTSLPLK